MVEIKTIINQNPWWKHGISFCQYDKDLTKPKFIEYKRDEIKFETGNIYVIRGPRQSGKTFWIKKTIKGLLEKSCINSKRIFYISCDSLTSRSRKELRRAIDFFLNFSKEFESVYIFLDEINFVSDWSYELKNLADSGLLSRIILIATGSSSAVIRDEVELLPGRGIEGNEYLLKPLSFRDFVLQTAPKILSYISDAELRNSLQRMTLVLLDSFNLESNLNDITKILQGIIPFKKELDFLFDIYLITGGLPVAINNYLDNRFSKNKEKIENEHYETFIKFVVGDISGRGKSESILRQIFQSVLKKFGTKYSFTTLVRDLEGVTHPTAIDYLGILEKSFITHTLYSYDFNKKAVRFKAEKKIYFTDPFIFYSINTWISGEEGYQFAKEFLIEEEKISKLVENILADHLARTEEKPYIKEIPTFLWFYYNGKKEIDFVYKRNDNSYIGVEAKYQNSVSLKDIKKIDPIKEYILLTKDQFEPKGDVLFVPIAIFLALLGKSTKTL